VVGTVLVVLALTDGGDGFRWFGKTVRDVSYDIAETLDLLHEATEDIKSASHTIRKTGTRIKGIAEETSEKASSIVNSTGEIVKDIKYAVTDVETEEKETSEEALGMSDSAGETASDMRNAVSDVGPDEKRTAGKKVKRRAVKKSRTVEKDDPDMEP
jgi:methyl-accepting chemotaxis protein